MKQPTPNRSDPRRRIAVIGAGAAGMLAAAEASRLGAEVILLEKNRKTGVKILMSGGSRCNITQNTDAKGILSAFGAGGRFLRKSVGAFGPDQVIALFHQLGVETKVEPGGKVFPRSDRALHVRDALERNARDAGVAIHLDRSVLGLAKTSSGWTVPTGGGALEVDRVIVTAGGKSWPGCGTTGDAYQWLRELGHTIVDPRPALVPLVGGYHWTHALSGLTLEDCAAAVYRRDDWQGQPAKRRKALATSRRGWLFTHFGFSGPAAMDVSGAITRAETPADTALVVDLLPDVPPATLESALFDNRSHGRKKLSAVLGQWLPDRLARGLVEAVGSDRPIAELARRQRSRWIAEIKQAEFPIQGTRGFKKAEVTSGGVALSEVDPRTMESRLVSGLYIAGEVLDVDGPIGGFNFQAAFSTGRAAGIAAAS